MSSLAWKPHFSLTLRRGCCHSVPGNGQLDGQSMQRIRGARLRLNGIIQSWVHALKPSHSAHRPQSYTITYAEGMPSASLQAHAHAARAKHGSGHVEAGGS